MALELPPSAQNVCEQQLARAAGFSAQAVVGAHDRLDLRPPHQPLERRQVGVPQIVRAHRRIERVPFRLRTRVHREMLRAGCRLEVSRVIALQAAHEGRAEHGRQLRVLAPRLLPAPPPRVAVDVDVGRPERQALVLRRLTRAPQRLVVLGPRLVRDGRGHPPHELGIPRRGQPDDLREHGGPAVARHPVERLVPVIIGRNAQPRHGPRRVHHLGNLFLQRHPAHQVLHAAVDGQGGVAKRGNVRHPSTFPVSGGSRKASSARFRFCVWVFARARRRFSACRRRGGRLI